MKLLGIDTGTGGTRAVLIDDAGKVLSSATVEHAPISAPHPGWAEQHPDDWWSAACRAIPECLARGRTEASEIEGIGLTGQMHGLVLLDQNGKVLRPSLIWCDQRTGAECAAVTEKIGAKRLIELTANPALTGFTLPKIWWVQKHEPEIWSRARTILLPKDYVRFRLTAARAIDVADASGTLLLDVVHRQWSAPMMEASRLSEEMLPRVFESAAVASRVSDEGARATGLRAGIPVVAGAGDQAAGAVGMGIVRPGAVSATIGTSGVVFAATASPFLDPQGRIHTFCHAVPNRWHVMGVTQAAGYSLRWFRDQFGVGSAPSSASSLALSPAPGRDPYDLLSEEASQAPAGSDGLLWAPYLMGERTPHLDPQARGALVGLTATHTRAHVIRAILEGVAFSLRDTLTIFSDLKLPVETIRLGGGGARGPLWQQIQADVYGLPVDLVEAEEGPAYGAALLAGVGVGAWPSVEDACDKSVRVAKRVAPDHVRVATMKHRYAQFRKLYPELRGLMHDLSSTP
ncbi:MAG TPA: xylulokinase [Candidatus Acidoferrales bacterium]|nr:xylulokinase [Candidatus Acidoferrales bacterium]